MERLLSIIIPIYNVESYLDRCMESIVNQTYKNLEIIMVDDGSPDNCPQMCDEWAKIDSRIQVIHKSNGGLSDARNAGIDIATGSYLLLVDSDDYLELDACEKLLSAMNKTNVDFVVGAIKEINGCVVSYQKRSLVKSEMIYSNSEFIIKSIDANEWYAPAVLNLYNRDFLNKHDLRFKRDILHEDMELLPRLYLSADKISYLDFPFYNYVIRDNSITTSKNDNKRIESILSIYDMWKNQFDLVEDSILKKKLYGVLVKHYLHSCREFGIKKWLIKDLDLQFALRNSLNNKERLKCILFDLTPNIYVKFWKKRLHGEKSSRKHIMPGDPF